MHGDSSAQHWFQRILRCQFGRENERQLQVGSGRSRSPTMGREGGHIDCTFVATDQQRVRPRAPEPAEAAQNLGSRWHFLVQTTKIGFTWAWERQPLPPACIACKNSCPIARALSQITQSLGRKAKQMSYHVKAAKTLIAFPVSGLVAASELF